MFTIIHHHSSNLFLKKKNTEYRWSMNHAGVKGKISYGQTCAVQTQVVLRVNCVYCELICVSGYWDTLMNKHRWMSVLVHSGCYNEITQAGWLVNNRNMSQFWRLESVIRVDPAWSRVGDGLPGCRQCHCVHRVGRDQGAPLGIFSKATSLSWSNHFCGSTH